MRTVLVILVSLFLLHSTMGYAHTAEAEPVPSIVLHAYKVESLRSSSIAADHSWACVDAQTEIRSGGVYEIHVFATHLGPEDVLTGAAFTILYDARPGRGIDVLSWRTGASFQQSSTGGSAKWPEANASLTLGFNGETPRSGGEFVLLGTLRVLAHDEDVLRLGTGKNPARLILANAPPSHATSGEIGVDRPGRVPCLLPSTETSPVASIPLLSPATPNPFGSQTTLVYRSRGTAKLSVSVVSVTGRHVRSWVEHIQSGPNQIHWDGRDTYGQAVASGIYFVRVAEPLGPLLSRSITVVR